MALSAYHAKHAARSDEEIRRRAIVKEWELKRIFFEIPFSTSNNLVRVGVLGCANNRFVPYHRDIFQRLLGKPIEMITFDIVIEHLAGEAGVVRHDLTTPLPQAGFDILFGHVLLKFIETEKQLDVLVNSYHALKEGGLAIHVFDAEDVETETTKQADGLWSVPLRRWEKELSGQGIRYRVLRWTMDPPGEGIPVRGARGGALILIKQ